MGIHQTQEKTILTSTTQLVTGGTLRFTTEFQGYNAAWKKLDYHLTGYTTDATNLYLNDADGNSIDILLSDIGPNGLSAASFSNSTGILTLTKTDASTVTVNLDGRFVHLTGDTMTGQLTVSDVYADTIIGGQQNITIDKNGANQRAELTFKTNGSQNWALGTPDSDAWGSGDEFFIGTNIASANTVVVITQAGNIGVKTITPTYRLDITGTLRATGNVYANSQLGIGTATTVSALTVNGGILTSQHGNSSLWNTAYTQRGSVIAGSGLTWDGSQLVVTATTGGGTLTGGGDAYNVAFWDGVTSLTGTTGFTVDATGHRLSIGGGALLGGGVTLSVYGGSIWTSLYGDSSQWNTAYNERGSQIAGSGLVWNGTQLDVTGSTGSSGTTSTPRYINVYDATGGQVFDGAGGSSAITVNLDTQRIISDAGDFTLSADTVTINNTDTYVVAFNVSFDSETGGARATYKGFLEQNTGSGWVEVPGSRVFTYGRQGNESDGTGSATIILQMNSGTQIRVRAQIENDGNNGITEASGTNLTIFTFAGGGSSSGTGGTSSIWSLNGSTAYYNSGNVAIGKTTASTALDVNGVITATAGNSTNWNTAYDERGSQIAGSGLTWNGSQLVITATTGGGTIDGGGLTNQVTYWVDSNTITGSTSLVWDGTRLGVGASPSTGAIDIATDNVNFSDGYGLQWSNTEHQLISVAGSHTQLNIGGTLIGYFSESGFGVLTGSPVSALTVNGSVLTSLHGNSSQWQEAYNERGSQIAGSGLTWNGTQLEVNGLGSGGTIGGSGVANQVAYWDGTTSLAGSTSLIWDGTRLGIGGTPSTGLLDMVNGSINFDNGQGLTFGGTNNRVLGVAGGTGGGYVYFWAGGSERLRINGDGNILIGTTTSTSALTINGGIWTDVHGTSSQWNTAYNERGSQIAGSGLTWDGSQLVVTATTGGSSLWLENGSDIYYNSGNVSIGTATSVTELTVVGTITTNSGGTSDQWYEAYNQRGSQIAGTNLTWNGSQLDVTGISAGGGNVSGNGSNQQVAYWVDSNTITGNTKLIWDGSQLGIGGTPTRQLHVQESNAGGFVDIIVENTENINPSSRARISIQTANGGGDPYMNYTVAGVLDWYQGVDVSDNYKIKLGTGSFASDPYLVIQQTGLIGINEPNPLSELHISSTGSSNDVKLIIDANGNTEQSIIDFRRAGLSPTWRMVVGHNDASLGDYINSFIITNTTATVTSALTTPNLLIKSNGFIGIGVVPTSKLDVAGTINTSSHGDSSQWQEAYNERGSQIAGSGLTWSGTQLVVTATTGGSSLWSENGSNIYYNSGNVGIGTDTPTQKLDVIGSINISGFYQATGTTFGRDSRLNNFITYSSDAVTSNRTLTIGNATYRDIILSTDNLAIGTATTVSALTVNGGIWTNVHGDSSQWNTAYNERGSQIAGNNLTWNGSQLDVTGISAGGGNVSGNGVTQQIAYWVDTDTIGGDTKLIWDGTRLGVGASPSTGLIDIASGSINFSDGYGLQWSNTEHQLISAAGSYTQLDIGGTLIAYFSESGFGVLTGVTPSALTVNGSILTSLHGNSSQWNTAYNERGSQIAGNGLTWNGTQLDVTGSTGSSGGTTSTPRYFNAYDATGGQTFAGDGSSTGITINLDTQRIISDAGDFTLTNDEVTVNNTDTYVVAYNISLDSETGGARATYRGWVEVNTGSGWVEVPGSRVFTYGRQGNESDGTGSATIILQINSGTQLRLRANVENTGNNGITEASGTNLTIFTFAGGGSSGTGSTSSIWSLNGSTAYYNSGNVAIGKSTAATALDVNGVITATAGNSTNWNTAYNERGSQIAGSGLTWNGSQLDVTPVTVNDNTILITGTTGLASGGTFTLNQSSDRTITIIHDDTSSLSGAYGGSNDGVVIEDITVDGFGHVTAIGTRDLDGRFAAVSHTHTISDITNINISSGINDNYSILVYRSDKNTIESSSGSSDTHLFASNNEIGISTDVANSWLTGNGNLATVLSFVNEGVGITGTSRTMYHGREMFYSKNSYEGDIGFSLRNANSASGASMSLTIMTDSSNDAAHAELRLIQNATQAAGGFDFRIVHAGGGKTYFSNYVTASTANRTYFTGYRSDYDYVFANSWGTTNNVLLTIRSDGQLRAGGGSVSLPTYSWTADTDSGMYRGTNTINWSIGATERMRITSDNQLLMAVNAAGSEFPMYSFLGNQTTGMYYHTTGGSAENISFTFSSNELFRVSDNGNAYVTGSFIGSTTLSDIKLKHDITSILDPLETINKLRGVNFKWNNDNRDDIGFIAQEVEDVLPQLVFTSEFHGKVKGLHYQSIIPLLTEGIKELKKQNEILQNKINELEERIK